MKTTITKSRATTTIEKSFVTKTSKGYEVTLTAYRRVISIGAEDFKSRIYFGVSYKGEDFGHNDMSRESLNTALEVINKYGQIK